MLLRAGAGVVLVTIDDAGPSGAMSVAIGLTDRALSPAVSILPSQLLAWRLAVRHGRRPGAYYRGVKVTTRE